LYPQVHREPSVFIAAVWTPAEVRHQLVLLVISMFGFELLVMVLFPSWPDPFSPQVQSVPFVFIAAVFVGPAEV
jgi:hypothetical protein